MKRLISGLLLAMAMPMVAPTAEVNPDQARHIAGEAYLYGVPLVMNYKAMYLRAVAKDAPEFHAPFNQITNWARLSTPADRAVVAPNADTPYSRVYLDLRAEPVVLSTPAVEPKRYFSVDVFGSRAQLEAAARRNNLKDFYVLRAWGTLFGLYGNSGEEALYLPSKTDADGQPLDGAKHHYRLRLPAGQPLPAKAFWSVTMYDGDYLLHANPINRHLINSAMLPSLRRDADGGLTLHIQHPAPYYSVQLVDLYTFNFDYLGSRTTGNGGGHFLVAGPDWTGGTPPGIAGVVRAETRFVNAFIRTQVFRGAGDLENVKKVQAGYKLQPLSAFLGRPAPPPAPTVAWVRPWPPGAQRPSLEFFDIVRQVLDFCPVHPSEKDLRDRFAGIGIVPGTPFDVAALTTDMKEALQAGMADGQRMIDERIAVTTSTADLVGTRQYLKNDYLARAVAAQRGLFANSKEEAHYLR